MTRKAMLGHKVRRLRREQALTQAKMAERLGISPSYLNLIENNQRQVTVGLLLRIGQVFDVDLHSFAEDDAARLLSGLREVFSDLIFEGADVKRQDLVDLTNVAPTAAGAVVNLYRAYREAHDDLRALNEKMVGRTDLSGEASPSSHEEVRDYFHERCNYFEDLEEAAEEIWRIGGLESGNLMRGLIDYLDRQATIRVKILPIEVMGGVRRRYDRHGRRILLSEMLPLPSRNFQLAAQIGLIKYRPLLDSRVAETGFSNPETVRLARIALANYLAGAVMMPYDRFYRAATAARYDIDVLRHRFEASFEQVCSRLTTLQRPGAKGVPFFLIRVDKAGNVSKRFSANHLHFARFGGACPRWNVHDAFAAPKQINVQVSEMPDGARYFSLARTVTKPGVGYRSPGQTFAIGLGCEIAYAAQLVYADGIDLASDDINVPIGLNCRVCERPDCSQRAVPPVNHRLVLDENVRGPTTYVFERV